MALWDCILWAVANSEAFGVVAITTETTVGIDVFVEAFDMDGNSFIPFVEGIGSVTSVFGNS